MVEGQKHTEEALAQKARLIDLNSDAILLRDASDRITFWNDGATAIYGYSRGQALGQVSHELFHTDFPEPLEQIKRKLARDGVWAGELRRQCVNGSKITVSARWVAERDDSGKIISVLESDRDISEIKRAQEMQNRLAAIVESSDDAIVSKNLDGLLVGTRVQSAFSAIRPKKLSVSTLH